MTTRGFGLTVLVAVLLPWLSADANESGRRVVDLSGPGWTLTEADGRSYGVSVPHAWNIEDGCDGKGVLSGEKYAKNSSCMNSYERKRVTYARDLPDPKKGRRSFVRCAGASITATVRVNGWEVGSHLGAFTAFCFEVTDALKATGNRLEIVVDNFSRDDVAPPVNADFTMYGGLYRDVTLIETPRICIDPVTDGACGVRVWPDPATGRVRADVKVLGAPDESRTFTVPGFRLWSPETPVLYTNRIALTSGDAVDVVFGFRTAAFRADGFYLNGRKRRIRGVNYHQDREGKGWAVSRADIAADIAEVKALGADGIRTAHYPHAGFTYAQCDERGLMAWCEQPNVNGLRFTDTFRSNVWRQVREMVVQLGNHPSIVCWSIFNEIYNKVPMAEGEPEAMMEDLREFVKALDPSRTVVAASDQLEKRCLNDVPEALGFNRYPHWYGKPGVTLAAQLAEVRAKTGRASVALAEYGAGGSPAQHGDARLRCQPDAAFHSEEYQAYVHARDYRDIVADEGLWGAFVWCMFDFGSDRRQEGARWGINDKGLVTFDHRTRKDAWYLYRANWTREPTLRLVGARRPRTTTNAVTTVLGFSNAGDVTLALNGRTVGTKRPDAACCVLWTDVPLVVGTNRVTLTAGGLTSEQALVREIGPNYDPAKIGAVRLEDPLVFADGARVAVPADWPCRRREILGLFEREMYGRIPAPIRPVVDVIDEGVTMGGYATRTLYRMYFRPDRSGPCVNWLLLAPRHAKKPVPALLFLNYGGNHELIDDANIPVPTCRMRPPPRLQAVRRLRDGGDARPLCRPQPAHGVSGRHAPRARLRRDDGLLLGGLAGSLRTCAGRPVCRHRCPFALPVRRGAVGQHDGARRLGVGAHARSRRAGGGGACGRTARDRARFVATREGGAARRCVRRTLPRRRREPNGRRRGAAPQAQLRRERGASAEDVPALVLRGVREVCEQREGDAVRLPSADGVRRAAQASGRGLRRSVLRHGGRVRGAEGGEPRVGVPGRTGSAEGGVARALRHVGHRPVPWLCPADGEARPLGLRLDVDHGFRGEKGLTLR